MSSVFLKGTVSVVFFFVRNHPLLFSTPKKCGRHGAVEAELLVAKLGSLSWIPDPTWCQERSGES